MGKLHRTMLSIQFYWVLLSKYPVCSAFRFHQGFSDRHTWVKNFYYDDSPLIFDENYERKASYYSLRDAIATMSVGGKVGGGVLLDRDHGIDGQSWGQKWIPKNVENKSDECTGDSRPDWLQT